MQRRENFISHSGENEENKNQAKIDENLKEKSNNDKTALLSAISSKSPQSLAIRQKSLFTANPIPMTKFNVAAPPFISSTSSPSSSHRTSARKDIILGQQFGTQTGAPVPHIPPIPHVISSTPSFDSRILRPSISSGHISAPPAPMYLHEDEVYQVPTFPNPFSNCRSNIMDYDSSRSCGPIALPNGTIQIRLRDGIRVDMTLDKAIRVINQRSRVAMSLSSKGSSSALIHPNGRVYQYGSRVEIVCYDGLKNNNFVRYAKMWYKGVSFTSENCALTYLVDTAGTRTTSDTFTDMSKDYTIAVFYNDSRHGPAYAQEAISVLQESKFQCNKDGSEIYEINGFRICQTADGLVKITRNHNKCLLRTSPGNGSATLTTPIIHCTASLGKTSHLFVRRGERRMHFDGSSFVVRNAGHSAGFDKNNLLNVY